MEEHEDPEREQRDSAFDSDPDAERRMDERFAEMAARAGAPDPRATDAVNKIMASKFAAPTAAAVAATMLRRPRLATQFFRTASSPATAARYSRFNDARRGFSTRAESEFQQPETGASVGMELVKWVVMTSVGTFVGVEGDKGIRATGNYILKTMKETSDEEMSKWPTGPDFLRKFLARMHKAPALGGVKDVDPEVDATLRQMYKEWYAQKESDFWAQYAQLVGSTSLPLDAQFVALSLISHLLPPSEMYYWKSQDDSVALLEACAQAVKDAGGKASAIYTCLAERVDALSLPRSIAADLAQMVVSTLIQPAAPVSAALCKTGGLSLGDPPVIDATFAFLENVSFLLGKELGPVVAGTLSFFQLVFPKSDDGLALVKAFVAAIDHLLDLHDIKDMRDDINHLMTTYLGLANALEDYYKLNQKNMPQADLKTPGTTAYDTFMAPLVEECVGTGKLSGIVDKLMNDDRYKVDCITLAMMAASLWIAYNGLYMQMCSYRDGQVSDDAALPYSTVLRFIRANAPVFSANVELFKAARLQHVSDVKEHYVNDHRSGSHSTYSIDDDAGPDAVPPGLGHYEEETWTTIWGTTNSDAEAHVHSKRDEWVATINSGLNDWASTAVDSNIKLWWANFVYQNSPYFYSTPPSAPQVLPGTGQTQLAQGPEFDKWWASDAVTYAITFKTDRGEGPRVESAPYKVEKGEVWVPDFPKDRPPPIIWPIPGHPELFSKRAPAVMNAQPDLIVPVDDIDPATVRLVYIKYGNGDYEPVPAAIAQLAKDSKVTRVSTLSLR